jgi:predicted nucleic acid-binding protein
LLIAISNCQFKREYCRQGRRVASSLSTQHGLLIADSLIAATALFMDVSFLSKNQKDYRFIEGLKLLPYPSTSEKPASNEEK